jgi:HEAT repeat protein
MKEIRFKKYRKKNLFSVKCAKPICTTVSISLVLFLLFNYPPPIHAVTGSDKKISGQSEKKNTRSKKILKKEKGDFKATAEKSKQEKAKDDDSSDKREKELKREKKSAEWIEKTLEYGIQKERKEALDRILTIKDKGIRKGLETKLIAIIRDEINPEVKTKAITVASQLELKEALPELIVALNDKSDDVKVASVYAIKKIHDTSATETLIKALKEQDLSKDSRLVEALIDTLGEFKAAQLGNFAIESIKDDKTSKNIRLSLVLFLGKTGFVESKNFLLQLLKDNDEEQQIRAYAASSLAHIGARDAAKEINDIIQQIESYPFKRKQRNYTLYIHCIAALAKLGEENVFPHLINSLRSDNATVRLQAIKLIKEIKNKRTIDILKYKMKHDPNPRVQNAAREALRDLEVDIDQESNDTSKRKEPVKRVSKKSSARKIPPGVPEKDKKLVK